MKNELVGISVGIVCALVLIGTVLVPMVDDVTAETLTYTNEGMPYAAVDDDTHTIVLSSVITVDGVELDETLFPSNPITIVYSTTDFVRFNAETRYVEVRGSTVSGASFTASDDNLITITISEDTTTVVGTYTRSFSDTLFYVSSEGDYVLSANPCVVSDTVMYGEGSTYFGSSAGLSTAITIYTYWVGTSVEIEATILTYTAQAVYSSCVVDDVEINTTTIDGDLTCIDSVLINYIATDTDSNEYELTSTYTYFLAPSEIVYDNPDYIGETESVLLGIVPLFTILAVFIIVTYAVMRNRD